MLHRNSCAIILYVNRTLKSFLCPLRSPFSLCGFPCFIFKSSLFPLFVHVPPISFFPFLPFLRCPAAILWWCLSTSQSSQASRCARGPPCTSTLLLRSASWWWLSPVTWCESGGSTRSSSPHAPHLSCCFAGSFPRHLSSC